MIKIKNLIAQITAKRNLKWVLVFLVLWWLFVWRTYAADGDMSIMDSVSWLLNLILSVASWIWILLANLAGKLMTNDVVYWSFLHLDASLWKLWNITKNFANFALWFMVLYAIVRNIFSWPFGKASSEWTPINTIKKTLIAWVLIQMSWFLMAAVVDLSTIMTSAIWSFPSQFIASDSEFRWNMTNSIRNLQKWEIKFNPKDPENLVKWIPLTWGSAQDMEEGEFNQLIDTLMPNHDSVSWPLIFLWLSVFEFNDIDKYSGWLPADSGMTEWWDLFMSLWMSAIILIFFSLMMFLIFIFNLFRVIMLWIIIPLLPIIILMKVFKLTDKLWGWGGKWLDLSKFMSIKTIMMLVFKPVLMVWTLSLVLVILVLIKNVISPNKVWTTQLTDQMTIETSKDGEENYTSTMKSEWIVEFSMSGVKDTIADVIVYFFWLFLIYFLVKMVVKTETGIGFIDKSVSWLFETVEGLASNLPIIPIWWWVGIKALKEGSWWFSGAATRLMWIDVAGQHWRIAQALWLWWSFDSLHSGMSRETFIDSSINAAKGLDYTSFTTLWNNNAFDKKLNEWNRAHNKDSKINKTDLEAAFDSSGQTKQKPQSDNEEKDWGKTEEPEVK